MNEDAYKKNNKPEQGAKPGIYKHELSSEELEVATFPAADALVRQGWVFDRASKTAAEKAAEVAEQNKKEAEDAKKATAKKEDK